MTFSGDATFRKFKGTFTLEINEELDEEDQDTNDLDRA